MSDKPNLKSFQSTIAYRNGEWMPLHELAWSVTDLGTTHGAMLVERLRTLGGKLFSVDAHLARLANGAEQIGIAIDFRGAKLDVVCQELLARNADAIQLAGDVGVVLLLSPGDFGIDRQRELTPTVMAHLSPIPFSQLSQWYRHGVSLHVSDVRNVPASCWSPSIKTRSRLQYYLADRASSDSIAVLLSTRGTITETSISNLMVLGEDGVLRSPPLDDILYGVSLQTAIELAKECAIPVEFVDLFPEDLRHAKEVIMTGTTGCAWAAVSVDGVSIGDGTPGPVLIKLQKAWEEFVGYPFTSRR